MYRSSSYKMSTFRGTRARAAIDRKSISMIPHSTHSTRRHKDFIEIRKRHLESPWSFGILENNFYESSRRQKIFIRNLQRFSINSRKCFKIQVRMSRLNLRYFGAPWESLRSRSNAALEYMARAQGRPSPSFIERVSVNVRGTAVSHPQPLGLKISERRAKPRRRDASMRPSE